MEQIRSLIETVVRSIVDETDEVQITEEVSEQGILYEISVSKDDVGKLIGKGGRVASALRTIAKASGAKNGVRVLTNVMNKPLERAK
jgi:predicted RNA-binding protein YlqC (UPF0109 family)